MLLLHNNAMCGEELQLAVVLGDAISLCVQLLLHIKTEQQKQSNIPKTSQLGICMFWTESTIAQTSFLRNSGSTLWGLNHHAQIACPYA